RRAGRRARAAARQADSSARHLGASSRFRYSHFNADRRSHASIHFGDLPIDRNCVRALPSAPDDQTRSRRDSQRRARAHGYGRLAHVFSVRLRTTLATAQIAISLLLLISAGLFAKSLLNLSRVNLGLRSDHLLTFSLSPKLNRYDAPRAASLYEQLLARLSTLPGIDSATASDLLAIADSNQGESIGIEGLTPPDGMDPE